MIVFFLFFSLFGCDLSLRCHCAWDYPSLPKGVCQWLITTRTYLTASCFGCSSFSLRYEIWLTFGIAPLVHSCLGRPLLFWCCLSLSFLSFLFTVWLRFLFEMSLCLGLLLSPRGLLSVTENHSQMFDCFLLAILSCSFWLLKFLVKIWDMTNVWDYSSGPPMFGSASPRGRLHVSMLDSTVFGITPKVPLCFGLLLLPDFL